MPFSRKGVPVPGGSGPVVAPTISDKQWKRFVDGLERSMRAGRAENIMSSDAWHVIADNAGWQ
jgi:hypothetical protein